MKAKDLFEKLGYQLVATYYGGATLIYENKLCATSIVFHTNEEKGNRLDIHSIGNSYQDSGMITFAELKAINKQIEELNWKDDAEQQISWFKKNEENNNEIH